MVVWHLKQVGKVNKSDKWVPHELTEYQKITVLKCHLLLLYTTTNHFSIWSWHAMKSRFYTTASNDQLSGWTKMKLQSTSHSQTCTKKKKRSWSPFGGLLPVLSTAAFWILVKPLHLKSMLSKSMRCMENCNACSQHWSTERAQSFPMTMPDCR